MLSYGAELGERFRAPVTDETLCERSVAVMTMTPISSRVLAASAAASGLVVLGTVCAPSVAFAADSPCQGAAGASFTCTMEFGSVQMPIYRPVAQGARFHSVSSWSTPTVSRPGDSASFTLEFHFNSNPNDVAITNFIAKVDLSGIADDVADIDELMDSVEYSYPSRATDITETVDGTFLVLRGTFDLAQPYEEDTVTVTFDASFAPGGDGSLRADGIGYQTESPGANDLDGSPSLDLPGNQLLYGSTVPVYAEVFAIEPAPLVSTTVDRSTVARAGESARFTVTVERASGSTASDFLFEGDLRDLIDDVAPLSLNDFTVSAGGFGAVPTFDGGIGV